ncbi:MAG: metallophosphoesterase family protein [Candidatus Methanoperedens sp.]|nr:metallophosphoesterase family protein [Candidatus Methanoperedens sp.]MCZ7394826.1 metallophosphoesterase family protein [Candidatus Methanoperedens sp.]
MLIGLIADVHSNAVALKEVLSVFDGLGVEKILHAGDIVGYNPYPDETIGLFRKNRITSILGNHDRALISGDTSGFNPYAAAALEWTRNAISPDNVDYILGLKNIESIVEDAKRIVMAHGSPYDIDEYVYPDDALPDFLHAVEGDVLVLGHTHIQFKKEYPEGIIVNPGSVGQPRDGNPDAGFAVLDTSSGKVELKRVSYDIEKVIEDMLAANLPEKLAFRLRVGR